jgi:hypothetical protein
MASMTAGSSSPFSVTSPQMPHIGDKRYAVVSCHVERPLDEGTWVLFAGLQERRPGGFAIAALMRPPDLAAGEQESRWLERAHEAATRGPLGHHAHFGGVSQARPVGPGAVERVRREATWLRSHALEPSFFCGGAWYLDPEVAETLADLGYADCTATAFRPAYLARTAPRVGLAEPAWLRLPSGRRLLELPTTHSLGMLARALLRRGALADPVVHAYFHDTDLLDPRRRAALELGLRLLGRRRRPTDLLGLALEVDPPEIDFAQVYAR